MLVAVERSLGRIWDTWITWLWARFEHFWGGSRGSAHLTACLKVVVSFYQILGSFLYTFPINWGEAHTKLMQYSTCPPLPPMPSPRSP